MNPIMCKICENFIPVVWRDGSIDTAHGECSVIFTVLLLDNVLHKGSNSTLNVPFDFGCVRGKLKGS